MQKIYTRIKIALTFLAALNLVFVSVNDFLFFTRDFVFYLGRQNQTSFFYSGNVNN